jgi:DNA polymerase-3 subunit gamma/tau
MSYQILARKYRPQQFDDLIAQEHISRTLKNALASGRLSSGYLFTGPRGTGKTTSARILAKALNCAEGPTPVPCDKCPSCLEIIAGSSLDVLEIDAASNTGVDDIRVLRENVRYMPTSGRKRVYIIDEVHRLSGSAFDALLKTLEEPPPHVVFIFATTEPFKVPETIRSRTQRYDFRRVGIQALASHLRRIAELEKIDIDEKALYLIARKADGAVRDSLSLLDQISAYSDEKITEGRIAEALGLVDRRLFFKYTEALAAKNGAAALDIINDIVVSGIEIFEFAAGVIDHFRHLMILQNTPGAAGILELSDSELEDYRRQVDFFTTGDLLRMIKYMTDAIADKKSGLDPRLLLETTTLKLANMESTIIFEEILARLTESTAPSSSEPATDLFGVAAKSNFGGAPAASAEKGTDMFAERSSPAIEIPPLTARPVNLAVIQANWQKFLEHLKTQSQMLFAMLSNAEIREVKDNIITAVFYNAGESSKQVVEQPNYMAIIADALRDFFKTNLKIKYEIDLSHKQTTPAKPSPRVEKVEAEKILAEDEKLRNLVERLDGDLIGRKRVEE